MPTIKHIENATRNLGAPPEWNGDLSICSVLPIRDVVTAQGPFMISAWELSPVEIEALLRGETLKVWISGEQHPVIALTVGEVG